MAAGFAATRRAAPAVQCDDDGAKFADPVRCFSDVAMTADMNLTF